MQKINGEWSENTIVVMKDLVPELFDLYDLSKHCGNGCEIKKRTEVAIYVPRYEICS